MMTLHPNPVFAEPPDDSFEIGLLTAVRYDASWKEVKISLDISPAKAAMPDMTVELDLRKVLAAFKTEDGSIFFPCFPSREYSVSTDELFSMFEHAGVIATFESLNSPA